MVRAPRYRYEDPIDRWRRSLIWQAPERIDDASDFYRRDLAGGDDEITLEDIERPPVFERRIDQRPLRPKDIPNDMLGRNPFQQAEFTPGMRQVFLRVNIPTKCGGVRIGTGARDALKTKTFRYWARRPSVCHRDLHHRSTQMPRCRRWTGRPTRGQLMAARNWHPCLLRLR